MPKKSKEFGFHRKKWMETAISRFMKWLGLNLEDPSLKDTPRRIVKMYHNELFRGLYEEKPVMTTFPNTSGYDGMVLVRDIEIKSLCEHHFMPFIGKCHIAYLPGEKIIGLSKIPRIVDWLMRRPQVQERLTKEIYKELVESLDTEDVAVVIEAEHMCMKLRGIEEPCADTFTAKLGGKFFNLPQLREEFYSQINK